MQHRTIIALVGKPSSGKDTAAAYLVERHDFRHISTADLIRFYIAEHQLGPITQDLLRDTANILRAEHGPDYLARLALAREGDRLVVSAMRNPAEVQYLKEKGARVICIEASLQHRFERARERNRGELDETTLEQFRRREEQEKANPSPNAQIVSEVIAMADHTIANDGDLDALQRQLDHLVRQPAAKPE